MSAQGPRCAHYVFKDFLEHWSPPLWALTAEHAWTSRVGAAGLFGSGTFKDCCWLDEPVDCWGAGCCNCVGVGVLLGGLPSGTGCGICVDRGPLLIAPAVGRPW